jgi:hypothetical protein
VHAVLPFDAGRRRRIADMAEGSPQGFVVIANWADQLKRLVPTN